MSKMNHDDLNELVQELRANKSAAPLPPAEFTAELRRQLLEQYEQRPAFDVQGLGRFLGTAMALGILAIAVVAAWLAMAQRPGTADNPQDTVPDPTGVTGTITTTVGIANEQISIRLGSALELVGYELNETDQGLEVTLYWHAREQPVADYTVSIGLMDENSNLVSEVNDQIGGHSHPTSSWATDENVHETYTLPIPAYAPEGRYELFVFVVDPQSGTRLPVRTNNERVLVFDGLVWLTDWLVEQKKRDRIWLISAHQAARATAGTPIHFEVVMGYELVSAPEAIMKLHLAHPDWESADAGRVPIDGVTDFVAVTADQDSVTFNFTVNPTELESIIGTPSPVLVAMLSEPAPVEADGRLDTYAVETFTDLPASLFALDQPVPMPPDAMGARGTIGMVSIQPEVSPPVETALTGKEPITFAAPIFYELSGVPETEIEVSLLQQTIDGEVSTWQAFDTERVTVQAGRGLFHVAFTLDPTIHLRKPTTIEITVGMVVPGSEEYRITNGGVASRSWRYEP